ncbi:MAG: sensor histidine kinase [Planctomycetota bacterium]|jgi:signal transduction histidine kinase
MATGFQPALIEELERVVAELPDAVRLIGRDGRILARNEAASILNPEGLDHLCEQGDGGGGQASCPACQREEVFARALFLRWHVALPHKNRPGDYYEYTLCPVRTANGQVEAVLEIVRDATVTLGLEQYLIGRAEKQDDEIKRRSDEAQQLAQAADSLKAELGALKDSQTEILYRDRLVAVSQLVAALAHEIHTPLGAMLSSADLLQRTCGRMQEALDQAGLDADSKRRLSRALESAHSSAGVMVEGAQRIQSIVRTLRLFSRLDEAPTQRVDLHEGLESTLELIGYRLRDRIRVVRDYGELPAITVRAEAINQVFLNLLLNAVHAIPGEGEIAVRTWCEGDTIHVAVRDSGTGIAADDLPCIFDVGFTTRAGKGGSGIGLALSRRIIEEHGGSIEVDSEPGAGATFTLALPLSPSEGDRS